MEEVMFDVIFNSPCDSQGEFKVIWKENLYLSDVIEGVFQESLYL